MQCISNGVAERLIHENERQNPEVYLDCFLVDRHVPLAASNDPLNSHSRFYELD
jgi:hypothetical protein